MSTESRVKVWDIAIRIFHWSLVVFFTIAYLTEDDLETIHVYAGYAVIGLILFRLVYGFIGTRYARFWDFIYSPAKTFAYFRSILSGTPKHYLGHNPLGGWMVVFLLVSISLTSWTGLELYATEGKGPLATNIEFIQTARADDDHRGEHGNESAAHEFWEDIHEVFANLTLLLVFLHVGGVIFSSMVHRENLVRAMITGYKNKPRE